MCYWINNKHAFFSSFQTWVCEFCGTSNVVEVVAEELPTEEATTYMIAAAPTTATQALQGSGITDSVVVFCIDTSGSMGVTTEVGMVLLKCSDLQHVFGDLDLCVD